MPQSLEESVIRILNSEAKTVGTGFLVADTLAVTCAHVIDMAQSGPNCLVEVHFLCDETNQPFSARVLDEGWSPVEQFDIAFLRLETVSGCARSVRLCPSRRSAGHPYEAMGFPRTSLTENHRARSEIVGLEKARGTRKPLLHLKGDEIMRGMSGGPVLDLKLDRVVGMVTSGQEDTYTRFAYAAPAEALHQAYPNLKLEPIPTDAGQLRRIVFFAVAALLIAIIALVLLLNRPAPLAEMQPFSRPQLIPLGAVQQVAYGERYLWFAMRSGLAWYDASSVADPQVVPGISEKVSAVAVDPSGRRAWFVVGDRQIYRYTIGETQPSPIPEDPQQPFRKIYSVYADVEGEGAWFGDAMQGVAHYSPAQGWSWLPIPADAPQSILPARSIEADPVGGLWVNSKPFVYRWLNGAWDRFDSGATSGALPNSVSAFAVDGAGRVWFGHPDGLTVLAGGAGSRDAGKMVWRTCDLQTAGLPAGEVLDLMASNNGLEIIVAAAEGISRFTPPQNGALPESCSQWGASILWKVRADQVPYWTANLYLGMTDYQMQGSSQNRILWLAKQGSPDIFFLENQ